MVWFSVGYMCGNILFVRTCMIVFVVSVRSLYSSFVESVVISIIMHGIALFCDFVRWVGLGAYAKQPSGAYVCIGLYGSDHCWYGICLVVFDGVVLCRYVALIIALSQNVFGNCDWNSIALVVFAMVWWSRSESMCWGVFLGTTRISMPRFASCVRMLLFRSSFPLSMMIVCVGVSVVFIVCLIFIILAFCWVSHVIVLLVIACLVLWNSGNAVRVFASCIRVMYLFPWVDVMSHVRVSMYSCWPGCFVWWLIWFLFLLVGSFLSCVVMHV